MRFKLFLQKVRVTGKDLWLFRGDVGFDYKQFHLEKGDDDSLGAFLRETMPKMEEFIEEKLKNYEIRP